MRRLLGSKTLLALLVAVVVLGPILHYFLPQVDVVRAVGGEVRRVDAATETGSVTTRDVYRIQTETLRGRPAVYQNEDAWLYFKFDSADLQAEVEALARREAVMAVRHYGWRIRFLSWFPNALSVWEVDEDYRHVPVFNILVLSALAVLAFLGVRRARAAAARRDARRAEAARIRADEEAARARVAEDEAAARRAREAEAKADARRDVDDFLNTPGSGDGR